ncbi:hypothetical protein EVG20_g4449 [Dentipellis fragilis]|uniref:Uncharacterized protein n=1 Tax=Dentipellis fragilis TaxID=205917 RepID=A0A4Y9YYJ1_9AGAM|nr:hypothetical protein EVG20_g4449 [Dentipellis fragilis]
MPTTDSRDSTASPVSPYDGASSTGTLSDGEGDADSGLGLRRFPNASTSTSTEDTDDVGFGHPLQRMVDLETLDERSEGFLGNHALYRMPVAGSSSTSSHYYFV